MSFTYINNWTVGETDIFLAPQVVLGRKDADYNLRQRSRTVSSSIWRSATWALRIISLAFAMILLIAGCVAAHSISVNGASGGTTVTAGASMSVAVAHGPGNATDWIGVCNAGVPLSSTQCDYAGYSWDYLNCTQTAPATGVTSATCSLSAPNVAGDYYAVFFSNNTYHVLASAPFQVTSASSPSITVNGASGGTTVTAGASMSVEVANGPGNRADWIGVCNSGATPAPGQCDDAGYSWDYLNCTQTYPSTGSTSASCSLAAPSAGGNYIVGFFSNDTYTVLASAPFTVSGGGGGGPSLVQTVSICQAPPVANCPQGNTVLPGNQTCVENFSRPIAAGDTIVGYVHAFDNTDTVAMWPQNITDNAGNAYNLTTPVIWQPFQEYVGIFYLTNVAGGATSITLSNFINGGSATLDQCDFGFTEYAPPSGGALSINAVAQPVQLAGTTPSFSISLTKSSIIWAVDADVSCTGSTSGHACLISPSGFSNLISNLGDNVDVFAAGAPVSAGTVTLTYDNVATGSTSYNCQAAGGYQRNGCTLAASAIAITAQ